MKDRWKNNISLKIMSVLFAILLWWTVVNIDDPVSEKRYVKEVTVTNADVITNQGKSYQIIDDTQKVVVTVKARRKVLSEIKVGDIRVTADLRELQGTSVPIRVVIEGFEGSYEEVMTNPRNIQVKTEETQKKTFPITVTSVGHVREGYVIGSMDSEPKMIDISGPKSAIGRISKVVAKVDVSELSYNTTQRAELIFYDIADNKIDRSLLSTNCDRNGVLVRVELWKIKSVELEFDTSAIVPAHGYHYEGIEMEPKTIKVAAPSELIEKISKIRIPAQALEKQALSENEEVIVDVGKYLPEGVVLADEDAGSVVVTIKLEKNGMKTLQLPVRSVKIEALSNEFEMEYGPEQEVRLRFEGPNDILKNISSESVSAVVDLSNYVEEGVYEVPVEVQNVPKQCTYLNGATIQIILTKK